MEIGGADNSTPIADKSVNTEVQICGNVTSSSNGEIGNGISVIGGELLFRCNSISRTCHVSHSVSHQRSE